MTCTNGWQMSPPSSADIWRALKGISGPYKDTGTKQNLVRDSFIVRRQLHLGMLLSRAYCCLFVTLFFTITQQCAYHL